MQCSLKNRAVTQEQKLKPRRYYSIAMKAVPSFRMWTLQYNLKSLRHPRKAYKAIPLVQYIIESLICTHDKYSAYNIHEFCHCLFHTSVSIANCY